MNEASSLSKFLHNVDDPTSSYSDASRSWFQSGQSHEPRRIRIFPLKLSYLSLLLVVFSCLAISGCGTFVGNASGNAGAGLLIALPNNVDFGAVPVGQTATATISLINKSTSPIAISQFTFSGQSFSIISPSSLPVTIAPGKTLQVKVLFGPTTSGTAQGQLSITSSLSPSPLVAVKLAGTGTGTSTGSPTLSINATNISFGDVTLNVPSTRTVTLSSTGALPVTVNSATVTGPGFTVSGANFPLTLNTGQSVALNIQFDPTVAGAASGQLTIASNSSTNPTAAISLSGNGTGTSTGSPALSINATNISFGDVTLNVPSTQTVTLTSTGALPVTVNSGTVTGPGFTVSGANFPLTLNTGQSVALNVQFDPTVAGAASGQLTITSNSSTNPTAVISLSGTGVTHEVDLNWNAPSASVDPIAGYNVYRAPGGTGSYQLISSTGSVQTTYMDITIQSGLSYDYVVKSFDATGLESAPSNITSVTIP